MSKIDYSKYDGRTKGNWKMSKHGTVVDETGVIIRTTGLSLVTGSPSDMKEEVANANLIADAPKILYRCKMLEVALVDLINAIDCCSGNPHYLKRVAERNESILNGETSEGENE